MERNILNINFYLGDQKLKFVQATGSYFAASFF
jgi:hypothetical protein